MFRKLSYLMLFVMLAILPTARAQVVGNLLQNPSFEEDEAILDDPDWFQWVTWNPAEGAGSNATVVDTEAADGARSLFVEPVGPANWHFIVLYMPIPTEVGTSYTTTFWAKAEEPRPFGVQYKATDNSVQWGYADFELTTEWAEYSLTAVAENAETKLEFFCAGSEIPLWLDNVSVSEESAPLVLNGSFEEDEPIHNDEDYFHWWTWGWEAGLASTAEIDESTSIDGTRSLRIEPFGSTNWYFIVAYSPILVELDNNYIISFWAKAEEPRPVTAQLKATDNSIGAWGATEFQLTTEWAQYSYLSEVQIDDVKLEILCAGSEVPLWLDFVSVYLEGEDPGIGPKGTAEAGSPEPADGAIDVLRDVMLSWKEGNDAVSHEVYLGTDFNDVNNADTTDLTGIYRGNRELAMAFYIPTESPLEWNQTYYWRIDEVNDADPNSPWKGNVWSFTTTNHVVVD
ncbi:MAG: carbohydrate binding domain-containing protein, partial [Planctomycetota bacterium]